MYMAEIHNIATVHWAVVFGLVSCVRQILRISPITD